MLINTVASHVTTTITTDSVLRDIYQWWESQQMCVICSLWLSDSTVHLDTHSRHIAHGIVGAISNSLNPFVHGAYRRYITCPEKLSFWNRTEGAGMEYSAGSWTCQKRGPGLRKVSVDDTENTTEEAVKSKDSDRRSKSVYNTIFLLCPCFERICLWPRKKKLKKIYNKKKKKKKQYRRV